MKSTKNHKKLIFSLDFVLVKKRQIWANKVILNPAIFGTTFAHNGLKGKVCYTKCTWKNECIAAGFTLSTCTSFKFHIITPHEMKPLGQHKYKYTT